ncbi:MAG: class I SAM-dependent methyltransferase [Gammaproteobacteria bacterium]
MPEYPPGAPEQPPDRWDMYWAHGFVTSCALAFSANYEGRMRGIWEEFFEALEPGARILDICTGNGAIAVIANQVSRAHDKAFEIHGIDSARIDPAATLKGDRTLLEGIHFHAGMPAERTSFGDDSFDAVTGQYALEYTDVPKAISEIARVLRAGGRCLFVMHHADSVVLETGREELRHARLLFEETALFERGRDLMRRMAVAATPAGRQALAQDADAEDKRQRLNAAAADVSAAIGRSAHPEMLRGALGALGRAWQAARDSGLEPALAMLDQAEREIRANEERLRDLLRAASDAARIEQILAHMHDGGLETQPATALHHEDTPESRRLVGWVVRAQKEP